MTYAILSDLHFHSWSQFASVDGAGVNSRLAGLCSEVRRAADELTAAGGSTMYLAGDIFHTRGSVEPVVLNTVMDLFSELDRRGIRVNAIPGNHDLATKDTQRMHNAAASLAEVGVTMVHRTAGQLFSGTGATDIIMFPWHDDLDALRKALIDVDPKMRPRRDVILHAPIDGVIKGIPDHGLDPVWLSGLGFRLVFAGHYHHHKQAAHNVYSIGALAHHTWSDVGSKAGFLLVSEGKVKWFKSHLPSFIDLEAGMLESDMELLADQNYVRAKIGTATLKEVEALRKRLTDAGARGVVIQSVKEPIRPREKAVVKSGETLAASVAGFIPTLGIDETQMDILRRECADIMAEAGAL